MKNQESGCNIKGLYEDKLHLNKIHSEAISIELSDGDNCHIESIYLTKEGAINLVKKLQQYIDDLQ